MSVTPHDLLLAAKNLHKTPSTEADRRALVNRAYYAAYQAAYEFHLSLPAPGSVGTASGKHEQLVAQLRNPTIKSSDPRHFASRRLGIILGDLLATRVRADYYPNDDVTEEDANTAMFQAQDIFNICYPPAKAAVPPEL